MVDYPKVIEGQITIWDYLKSCEPQKEPDDHVCEGCKWRTHESRRLEIDEHGQTWVSCCPGTACANWRNGTPLNLSGHFGIPGNDEEWMYCYNRDFLPDMEHLLPILEQAYDMTFKKKVWDDGDVQWEYKYRKQRIYIDESTYMDSDKRFVGVNWEGHNEGFGRPCDNLEEVLKAMDRAFERMEEE